MTREELLQTAKPIIFNTEMVRAILDDRKTVTRRCVKPQPKSRLCYTFAGSDYGTWGYPAPSSYEIWGEGYRLSEDITKEDIKKRWKPPYHTDDILYVRKTFQNCCRHTVHSPLIHSKYCYRASNESVFYGCIEECGIIDFVDPPPDILNLEIEESPSVVYVNSLENLFTTYSSCVKLSRRIDDLIED